MSRKEWVAVVVVIGLGIVWQIAGHDDAMTGEGEQHTHSAAEMAPDQTSAPADPTEAAGPYRTVALEVTGMT